MPDEAYFMAFGALGLSLAGFAGVVSALSPRPTSAAAAAIRAYRIRLIVFLGFSLTFVGFGAVALYAATGDTITTVRLATLAKAVPFARGLLLEARPSAVWSSERERLVSAGLLVAMLVVTLGNLLVASVGYLELLLMMSLIGPVTIFYNTIRDATAPDATAP